MEEILSVICILALGIFLILVYIATVLKGFSSRSLYRNNVLTESLASLEEINESLSKILIAERIILKNEYKIDLEEFYSKYMSEREKANIDKYLKERHNDY